jgi:hypothetical protein
MHEQLKYFKFVRGCNTTVPILYINLIKYVKTLFLVITGSPQYKQAPGSFIFSLRNKEDLSPFKAPLKDQNTTFAIYTYHICGPVFGGGHDLFIYNNAALNTYTNFNYNYQAPCIWCQQHKHHPGRNQLLSTIRNWSFLYCLELISIYIRALNILISQTKFKVHMQRNLHNFLWLRCKENSNWPLLCQTILSRFSTRRNFLCLVIFPVELIRKSEKNPC